MFPLCMAFAPVLTIVCHFKPQSIRVVEEYCPVVWCVLRIQLCISNIRDGIYSKAEAMEARRIRIVHFGRARRTHHKTKVAIEVLDVRISVQREAVLVKAQRTQQNEVVERLRACQITYESTKGIRSRKIAFNLCP